MLSEAATERQLAKAFEEGGAEDWERWWDALAEEPGAQALLEERARRFAGPHQAESDAPIFDVHVAALRNAGFREVGAIWQRLDNRVLLGVR
jgi:hypothetical protein